MSEESLNEAAQDATLLEVEAATEASAHQDSSTVQPTGQVTTCAAPPAVGKWTCDLCTYENFPLSRKCTMCLAPKPSLGSDIFRLQEGAAAAAAAAAASGGEAESEVEAVAERLRPLRVSSPPRKWACAACTYENWPKAQKCAMCDSPASASAPAPASAAAHQVSAAGAAAAAAAEAEAEAAADAEASEAAEAAAAAGDAAWLAACRGVVEGDARRVLHYLRLGGDPARALAAPEVRALDRASAFDVGHTLVHLAIRFQRQDILTMLLSRISGGGHGLKRSPSHVAPDLATAIRRHIASCMRQNKGGLAIRYLSEVATFCLPAEIEELPAAAQERLFDELLDRDAQHTLEADPPLINWSQELTGHDASRLYALWNRSAGDCLLDSVSQAAYGVSDRGGVLRAALAASLRAAAPALHPRWAAAERAAAGAPAEPADWARAVQAAARPRRALLQLHVFVLAHILRRPVLVYGVDVVNSFRGEPLGYARFQGIYLPLLWEDEELCSKWPLSLGYTRGHFSALVPLACRQPYICRDQQEDGEDVTYLPLTDCEGKLLPVHFLDCDEMMDVEGVVRRWVDADVVGGVLVARRPAFVPPAVPMLQRRMLRAWLDHYRQQPRGPYPPRLANDAASDDD